MYRTYLASSFLRCFVLKMKSSQSTLYKIEMVFMSYGTKNRKKDDVISWIKISVPLSPPKKPDYAKAFKKASIDWNWQTTMTII